MAASIVCGVDGSAGAAEAARVAARLAERLGLRLVVAHVAQVPVVAGAGPLDAPVAGLYGSGEQRRAAGRLVEAVVRDERLAAAEQRVAFGFPAERLTEIADAEDAAIIVVGSRGRGPFRAAFLGSVSSDLVGLARCPVLVVPPDADADGL